MAKRTVYVVVKNDWEYNDEFWYQPEGEGYTALKGYSDKKKAEKECALLNEEEFDPDMVKEDYNDDTGEYEPITNLYKVVALEVEE